MVFPLNDFTLAQFDSGIEYNDIIGQSFQFPFHIHFVAVNQKRRKTIFLCLQMLDGLLMRFEYVNQQSEMMLIVASIDGTVSYGSDFVPE